MMTNLNNIKLDRTCPAWSLPRVIIIITCLSFLAAFLIPLPEKILDVLWVFLFCLSGAVTIICAAAQSSSDLIGFAPMISGLTLLRLIVQTGTARRIIQDEPAGILLGSVGSALASSWSLGAVLICLLMAVIVVVVVFVACQRITLASTGYCKRVFPLKRMGLETDLRLGVIDEDQANTLAQRVVAESRFFAGMNGTALLIRVEATVSIFILLGCLLVPAAGGSVDRPPGIESLTGISVPVVGLSVFTLIPALIVALACGALMGKDKLSLRTGEPGESATSMQAKTITVVALDGEPEEDTELLNPDFVRHRDPQEKVVTFEPETSIPQDEKLPVSSDISCRNEKEYYEKLSDVICTINSRPRVVMLASDKVHSLPVTVAVNIAIRLAQKRQKVLLVDTDGGRNAVAKVFDLDPESMQKKVQPSSFENLSLCCVPGGKLPNFLRDDKILDRFGTTLIYTPHIPSVTAGKGGNPVRPGAFYFIDDQDPNAGQKAAEKLGFCSWLCLIPSIQSVLDTKS